MIRVSEYLVNLNSWTAKSDAPWIERECLIWQCKDLSLPSWSWREWCGGVKKIIKCEVNGFRSEIWAASNHTRRLFVFPNHSCRYVTHLLVLNWNLHDAAPPDADESIKISAGLLIRLARSWTVVNARFVLCHRFHSVYLCSQPGPLRVT